MHVYACAHACVFKYISTALYYIHYTHKSVFQFKHAFNFEDLGKQTSMCKDIQDYTQTSKKGDTFAIMHIYVSDCIYKGRISIHSHLMCLARGMLVCD